MIIPKHKVCDICEKEVGINNRYYIIKSKNLVGNCFNSTKDNRTHHICKSCMREFTRYLETKLKGSEEK